MQSVVAQILSQHLARLALYLALPQAVKQPDDSVNQLRDLILFERKRIPLARR
jgi:hypothetical protein